MFIKMNKNLLLLILLKSLRNTYRIFCLLDFPKLLIGLNLKKKNNNLFANSRNSRIQMDGWMHGWMDG